MIQRASCKNWFFFWSGGPNAGPLESLGTICLGYTVGLRGLHFCPMMPRCVFWWGCRIYREMHSCFLFNWTEFDSLWFSDSLKLELIYGWLNIDWKIVITIRFRLVEQETEIYLPVCRKCWTAAWFFQLTFFRVIIKSWTL